MTQLLADLAHVHAEPRLLFCIALVAVILFLAKKPASCGCRKESVE